jgi:ligand-binding SRPBCC domain-containing protein
MQIHISTVVSLPPEAVWKGFTAELFTALTPPFPPVRLLRFDGSMPQDEVHLELNFIFFKQRWISIISEQQQSTQEIYFVDKGTTLPFFLKTWEHKHRLVAHGQGTLIIDQISFSSPWWLSELLLFPALYLQFLWRKPIYKRYFKAI